jgi:hypothetical protein
MVMRKILLILAAVLAVSYSCSNDEVVEVNQGEAISFRPLMTNVTRAADQSFTETSSGKAFKVTAFETGAETNCYFRDVTFTSDGIYFKSGSPIYWPSGYNLDFYAFTPIDGATATLATTGASGSQIAQVTSGDPNIGYKKFTVIPSSVVASQADLVFANTDNWGKFTGLSGQKDGKSGVTINFRHAGAKIRVMVKNTNANLKFEVSGWKVANVDGEAIYTYSGCTGGATDTDTQNEKQLKIEDWSDNSDAQTIDYSVTFSTANVIPASESTAKYLDNNSTSSASATTTESLNMILIPQTTIAVPVTGGYSAKTADAAITTGSYIALKLVAKNPANDGVIADATTDGKWAIWPVAFTWVPGKCYTYTVDLAGGGYWEANIDGSESDDTNLDPILEGGEIKFVTVTVDSWSNADGVNVPE